jgi:flagella synthesis protein FlgN
LTGTIFDPLAGITRERDATREFIDVLHREQHALQQPDMSLLRSLATEKAQQAQQLTQLADARNRWLAMLGYPQDRLGMERGLQECPAAAAAWKELLQLAENAHQLNKINGILVDQRLRHVQQRLSVLQSSVSDTPGAGLYGADGQPQPFSGGRCLAEG